MGGFQSGPILKCLTPLNLDLETLLVGFSHQLSIDGYFHHFGSLIDIPIQPHFGWPFSISLRWFPSFGESLLEALAPKKKHQPKGVLRLKSPFSHEFRKNRLTHRVKHSPSKNLPIDQWMDGIPRYEDLLFPTRVAARTAQVGNLVALKLETF